MYAPILNGSVGTAEMQQSLASVRLSDDGLGGCAQGIARKMVLLPAVRQGRGLVPADVGSAGLLVEGS